jgi:hypothetical protein
VVLNGGDAFSNRGQRIFADGTAPINVLPETGGWYAKADYPGLFEEYVNNLPPAELGTGSDTVLPTGDNKYKWIIGVSMFWVPDTRDQYIKASGVLRLSGSHVNEAVGSHTHPGLASVPTRAHASSSSALSGSVGFLVNTAVSTPQGVGNVSVTIAQNATGQKNDVDNVASNLYRLL